VATEAAWLDGEKAQGLWREFIALDRDRPSHGRTIAGGRIAYLTGCVGGEEIESELRACKLRYAVIENPAAVARDLLRSGEHIGQLSRVDLLEVLSYGLSAPSGGFL
jgi:hypothetical protein